MRRTQCEPALPLDAMRDAAGVKPEPLPSTTGGEFSVLVLSRPLFHFC